jgi:hypothetical protein
LKHEKMNRIKTYYFDTNFDGVRHIIVSGNDDNDYNSAEGKGAKIAGGLTAAAAIAGGLAALRASKPLSEVEKICGRRPLLPGKKRNEWEKCNARHTGGNELTQQQEFNPPPQGGGNVGLSKGAKIGIGLGATALIAVILVIALKS